MRLHSPVYPRNPYGRLSRIVFYLECIAVFVGFFLLGCYAGYIAFIL